MSECETCKGCNSDLKVSEAIIEKLCFLKDFFNLDVKDLDHCDYVCHQLERDEIRERLHNELDKIRILIDYFAIK